MPRRILYLLCSLVMMALATGFLFFPEKFWSLYGVDVGFHTILVGRYLASVEIGNTLILLSLINSKEGKVAQIVSLVLSMEWAIVAPFIAHASYIGKYNFMGWITVFVSVFFTIFFFIDGFSKKRH